MHVGDMFETCFDNLFSKVDENYLYESDTKLDPESTKNRDSMRYAPLVVVSSINPVFLCIKPKNVHENESLRTSKPIKMGKM